MNTFSAQIDTALHGQRLDKALVALFPEYSRSRLQSLIEAGAVTVNNTAAESPKFKVQEGMHISMTPPPATPTTIQAEPITLDVKYEDEYLLIINKPAGLVMHPAPGNYTGTLVNAVLHHCGDTLPNIGGEERPGIVHRLDKDTSGLVVVAKEERTHAALVNAFQERSIEREYQAIIWGRITPPLGTIKTQMARHPKDRLKMAVVKMNGKQAITQYRTVATSDVVANGVSLIRCKLETGRTHQIRVHLQHKGHPLLGDPVYGGRLPGDAPDAAKQFKRQALHATKLGITHPITAEWLLFEEPMPKDMQQLATSLSLLK